MIEADEGAVQAGLHRSPYRMYGGERRSVSEKVAANPAHSVVGHIGHIGAWRGYVGETSIYPNGHLVGVPEAWHFAHFFGVADQRNETRDLLQQLQTNLLSITDESLLIAIAHLIQASPVDTLSDKFRIIAEGSEFLERLYGEKETSHLDDSVLGVIQTVFGWLSSKAYRILDFVVESAQAESLSTEVIVALLRTSSQKASFLPGWRKFLEDAKAELSVRGLDAQMILRGL